MTMANSSQFSNYAFIAIGANLPSEAGDPLVSIAFAFNELLALTNAPLLRSSVYLTSPVDSPAGTPDFYNAMAGLIPHTTDTALDLLHKLQAIENSAGRRRSGILNEARTLDLDLITFKSDIINTKELILPHPRAHQRRFVLEPLIEMVGKAFLLPGKDKAIGELNNRVSEDQKIDRLLP